MVSRSLWPHRVSCWMAAVLLFSWSPEMAGAGSSSENPIQILQAD